MIKWIVFVLALFVSLDGLAQESSPPAALAAARQCREQSEADACARAIRLGLSPRLASEAYTFWADTFPKQVGYTEEPVKLLRKAIELDSSNALAAYLLASDLPPLNYKLAEEKQSLFRKASELRPEWDAPLAQLAVLAGPWNYQEMIRDWSQAVELVPDDPGYREQLRAAREGHAAALAKRASPCPPAQAPRRESY